MYDHTRKAGNRGDVWKHFTLLETVRALSSTLPAGSVFRYFETHAGGGTYVLQERGEWQSGIGRDGVALQYGRHPFFRIQPAGATPGDVYHGSWHLVAAYLRHRRQPFHFILCDIVSDVRDRIAPFHLQAGETLEPRCTDGFVEIRRSGTGFDLVLLDPPYYPADTTTDWVACMDTVTYLRKHNVPYLAWYPLFTPDAPGTFTNAVVSPAFEIRWQKTSLSGGRTMRGAGMLASHEIARILTRQGHELEKLAQSLGGVFATRTAQD